MKEIVLVTYSTRTGSTKGVAEYISEKLSDLGVNTDIIPMQEVTDLSLYSAVIAGSAIQAGKWLPEAMDFIKSHQLELKERPFAAFLVCMTLAMPKGSTYRETISSWLQPVRDIVKPVSEGLFAGTLDVSRIPALSDRIKFRLSVILGVWKEGDHRDWDSIRSWTYNLKEILDSKK